MRWGTVAAVATASAVGAGAAALVAGRVVSDLAVRPHRPGPAGATGLRVHSTAAGRVGLTRTMASTRYGRYGLDWPGGHAVVGEVLETTAQTVVRRLERVQGILALGSEIEINPQVLVGDPRTVHGLDFSEVQVHGELGSLPAWHLPGIRDLAVIAVHGLGADRQQTLPLLPLLDALQLPVFAITYRNDEGAPPSPDGLGHLGDTEWRDVEAAIRLALDSGARRVLLHGWSIGATMALQTAARSPWRDKVRGLVLDSPILDWRGFVRRLTAGRGVPGPLAELGVRAAAGRLGLDTAAFARMAQGEDLRVPTLVLHSPDDTVASWHAVQLLADRQEELVSLQRFQGADHAALWNIDPQGYEDTVRRFLTPLI
jgi:hypothetical protein